MNQVLRCPKCKSMHLEETGYSIRDLISWQVCLDCETEIIVKHELVIKEVRERSK